jgi:hypothetical protein
MVTTVKMTPHISPIIRWVSLDGCQQFTEQRHTYIIQYLPPARFRNYRRFSRRPLL